MNARKPGSATGPLHLLLLCLVWPVAAVGEPVVVMSRTAEPESLTGVEVRQLFTGRLRQIQGLVLTPLDMPAGSAERDRFYRLSAGKAPDQMRSHWARMVFTGQGYPPREVSGSTEMILLVESSDDYIGYLDSADVTDQLKVVYRFPSP
jgi:hypothetical protein